VDSLDLIRPCCSEIASILTLTLKTDNWAQEIGAVLVDETVVVGEKPGKRNFGTLII
jgi:hypothetical protein